MTAWTCAGPAGRRHYREDVPADPVLLVQRAGDRFATEAPGVSTRHAFSFGRHYDPDNVGFGTLVAHNDERLTSGHGFDDHPHADTEIVTWVLSGRCCTPTPPGTPGSSRPARSNG